MGQALKLAWFLFLAAVSLALIAGNLVPIVMQWNVRDTAQTGQFTLYNRILNGAFYGMPVEAGDYDHDGRMDLVLSPMAANTGLKDERLLGGEVFVYRGTGNLGGELNRAEFTRDQAPGLTIMGARTDDFLGTEVFSADVNGDSITDLLISSQNYDGPRGDRPACGGVFIVLGRQGLLNQGSVLDLLIDPDKPPEGVITIMGAQPGDRLGIWVEAGDLDGDGFADTLMGADQPPFKEDPAADKTCLEGEPLFGPRRPGMAVVLYGRSEFPAIVDLAAGPQAIPGLTTIHGKDHRDHFGCTLHARDLDGDGRAELIVSAALNRFSSAQNNLDVIIEAEGLGGGDGPLNDRCNAGEVTVFFSNPEAPDRLPPVIDLAQEPPEFPRNRMAVFYGSRFDETSGEEVTTGDLDGDRYPELVIGALTARSPDPAGEVQAGRAYILYGAKNLRGAAVDAADLRPESLPPGVHVSQVHGLERFQILGDTLASGDLNRDGFDDLAVGIPRANVDTAEGAGRVAVIFGRAERLPENHYPDLGPPEGSALMAYIRGANTNDMLSYSMEVRDYDDDGYDDVFTNAMGGDGKGNVFFDAGEAYVVSGFHLSGEKVSLASIDPPSGPTGAPVAVTLRGRGFTRAADTQVFVEGKEAANVKVIGESAATAELPPWDMPVPVKVELRNRHGAALLEGGFRYTGEAFFIRGDANDNGELDIGDAIYTLYYLYLGGPGGCSDRLDADDSGEVDMSDPLRTLYFLFIGGTPPPEPPYPEKGQDLTPDKLGCP